VPCTEIGTIPQSIQWLNPAAVVERRAAGEAIPLRYIGPEPKD
jgi:hypothetical protein